MGEDRVRGEEGELRGRSTENVVIHVREVRAPQDLQLKSGRARDGKLCEGEGRKEGAGEGEGEGEEEDG